MSRLQVLGVETVEREIKSSLSRARSVLNGMEVKREPGRGSQ